MLKIIALIESLADILAYLEKAFRQYAKLQREKWEKEGRELERSIQDAKTDEERDDLARRLGRHDQHGR